MKIIDDLISFYKEERKMEKKSNAFMAKIYENRVDENLKWDRDVIMFLFDKMWVLYHREMLTKKEASKLLYGFEQIGWQEIVHKDLSNYLEYRKANLNWKTQ